MNKSGPVRQELVQKDNNCENWGLTEISENLNKFIDRNILLIKKDEINSHNKLSKKMAVEHQRRLQISDNKQQPLTKHS